MIRLFLWLWLLAFVAAPLLIVLGMGWGTAQPGIPPVRGPIGTTGWQGSAEAWALLLDDDFYLAAALRSFRLAALTASAGAVQAQQSTIRIGLKEDPDVLDPTLAGT